MSEPFENLTIVSLSAHPPFRLLAAQRESATLTEEKVDLEETLASVQAKVYAFFFFTGGPTLLHCFFAVPPWSRESMRQ